MPATLAMAASFAAVLVCGVSTFAVPRLPVQMADGFDFPVGKPDADNYYRFRGFRTDYHLGEDWNGVGGGDSDLGKPVYSIAHGIVVYSDDYRSNWGNVIIVRHAFRDKGVISYVDSLYGHLNQRFAKLHDPVSKGQKIGTIGTNHGMYTAHLHFEIRKNINVGLVQKRYAMDYSTYYSPHVFIEQHRFLPFEFEPHPVPVDCFNEDVKSRYSGIRLAQLPEDPLRKGKPLPRLDPVIKEVLQQNGFLPPPSKASSDASADTAEAEERAKIKAYWSATRNSVDEGKGKENPDRRGHDDSPDRKGVH